MTVEYVVTWRGLCGGAARIFSQRGAAEEFACDLAEIEDRWGDVVGINVRRDCYSGSRLVASTDVTPFSRV